MNIDQAKNEKVNSKWWSDSFDYLAEKLSSGVKNEMLKRITTSNIQKQKLNPNENSERMKQFFVREIDRYEKRKKKHDEMQQKKDLEITTLKQEIETQQQTINKLVAFIKKLKDTKCLKPKSVLEDCSAH